MSDNKFQKDRKNNKKSLYIYKFYQKIAFNLNDFGSLSVDGHYKSK